MKIIDDLRNRVNALNDGLTSGRLLSSIIEQNEAYICDMNAQEQLYERGENRLGVSIMDYQPYSPVTIEIKKAKGQPYNRVTLRDEGDFEASFFLQVGSDSFEIKASDFKAEHLVKRYGHQILGLSDENKLILIWQYIYPDLLEKVNEIL